MPRKENPLPEGPLHDFAAQLRALREEAGQLTYRELSRRANYSSSALSAAAGGEALPTLELTLAYVRACGGDVDAWRSRWQDAAAANNAGRSDPGAGSDAGSGGPATVPAPATEPTPAARRETPPRSSPRSSTPPRGAARIRALRPPARTGIAIGAAALIVLAGFTVAVFLGERVGQANRPRTLPHTPATSSAAAGTPSPSTPVAPVAARGAPGAAPGPASSYSYDQTTGPGCPNAAYATINHDSSSPSHRWSRATAVHWTVAKCADVLLYSEPTTEANPAHWMDDFEWYFEDVPATAACTFRIYVPVSSDASYTASYFWTRGPATFRPAHAFTIDQGTRRGTWYAKGPFSFGSGKAMLEVTDARSSAPDSPLAAAAVSLTCK